MDTINAIELGDESVYPDDEVLRGILGPSFPAYESLLALYASKGLVGEWRYYRDGKSWLCKVQRKKKTIVWMSAWKGYMQATVYYPVSKLDEVFALNLSDETKERIRSTKDVGKTKPCIFEVRDEAVLDDLERMMELKMGA